MPASLWLRKDLTWFQKCLLAEVASFDECFASNAYLAKMMGCSAGVIANEISKLRKKKLILDWGFDGRRRQVTVAREVHPNPFGEGSSTDEGRHHLPVNIDTSELLESKESKETGFEKPASFSSEFETLWKPDTATKEQKLKRIRTPRDYPSESEFDSFLESRCLDSIVTYRPDLYSYLCDCKWHRWETEFNKWVRIRDWKKYLLSFNDTIQRA